MVGELQDLRNSAEGLPTIHGFGSFARRALEPHDLKLIVIHDPPTDDNFAPLVEAVAHIMAIVFIGGNVWTRRTLGVCLPPRPR